MSRIDQSRRRFLRAVGFGAGAQVLLPVATLLHSRAYGAEIPSTKKVVFISLGGGLPDAHLGVSLRKSETDWGYHEALEPLSPWRSKTAILRGLHMRINGSQHSAGVGLLSCTQPLDGNAQDGCSPGGPSIDQVLGAKLSAGATLPTLLFGIDSDATRFVHQSLFASAKNQPTPYPVRATTLFERLFPDSSAAQSSSADSKRVLTRLRADISRLRARLAGEERAKLDQYLSSIDAFDRRSAGGSICASTALGVPEARGVVAELPSMLDMAVTALRCGMTNVVGCAIGGGNSHSHYPALVGPHLGTRFEAQGYIGVHGHDAPDMYFDGRTLAWRWVSLQVANFLRHLEAPTPDGRRLIDDTTVVLFSDSGPDHHNGNSYRFVVIGDGGGGLRTGGRFLNFVEDVYWEPLKAGSASVNSFMTTLANGVGVPLQTFGDVLERGRSSAPLEQLLA